MHLIVSALCDRSDALIAWLVRNTFDPENCTDELFFWGFRAFLRNKIQEVSPRTQEHYHLTGVKSDLDGHLSFRAMFPCLIISGRPSSYSPLPLFPSISPPQTSFPLIVSERQQNLNRKIHFFLLDWSKKNFFWFWPFEIFPHKPCPIFSF